MIFIMYGLAGVGITLVSPMSRSLVGNLFPPEHRTKALAWLTTGVTFSYIVGAPIIGVLAGIGGWRLPFLAFCLPILVLALVLAFKGLPDTQVNVGHDAGFFSGYKSILRERSAVACLLATMLTSMAYQSIGLYSTSFYREIFSIPSSIAATYITVGSLSTTTGIQASGWLVSKYGRKNVSVGMGLVSGVCYIVFMMVKSLGISLVVRFAAGIFAGLAWNSVASLTLEQGGEEKGPIMSLYSAFMNLGLSLGSAFGGLLLVLYSYGFMGIGLGLLQLVSVIVIFLYTSE